MKHTPKNVPIIVPCFNRDEFLIQSLGYLSECDLIDQFEVFFCFDNKEQDSKESKEVLDICNRWSHSAKTIFVRDNIWHGSLNSTGAIGHTMKTIGATGGFIYIEEDVTVAKCFLKFCLDALNTYDQNKHVMMVAGHSNRMRQKGIELPIEVSLAHTYSCAVLLGMASWWNRWSWIDENLENFCKNPLSIKDDLFNNTVLPEITGHVNERGAMRNLAGGGLITACMLKDGRVCLAPSNDLADHIGWYGWHIPKQSSIPDQFAAKSETFHQDNTYSSIFPEITKEDVAECFHIDVQEFSGSRVL